MTRRNNSQRPALWPYGFGVAVGIGSFSVTRGAVGQLFGCVYLFSTIAVAYWLALCLLPARATALDSICHLFWGELCSIVGMSLDSQLEEMAGMLYLIVPAATAIVFFGEILVIALRSRRCRKPALNRNRKVPMAPKRRPAKRTDDERAEMTLQCLPPALAGGSKSEHEPSSAGFSRLPVEEDARRLKPERRQQVLLVEYHQLKLVADSGEAWLLRLPTVGLL